MRGVDGAHQLPSLSDMLEDGRMAVAPPVGGDNMHLSTGFVAANHPRSFPEASSGVPGTATPRGPLLRHDHSSNSSVGSISPGVSFARTPGEGPLPIHALLSHQASSAPAFGGLDRGSPVSMAGGATPSPTETTRLPFGRTAGPRGYGT